MKISLNICGGILPERPKMYIVTTKLTLFVDLELKLCQIYMVAW